MLPEFHNKPSVVLRGNTWDVKHLDNFLASQWGEKLFQSKKPSVNSGPQEQLPMIYSNSSIRPSAAFMSLNRSQPPVQSLEKSFGNTLIHKSDTRRSFTPPSLDIEKVSKQLVNMEKERARDNLEYMKTIPPSKRKQLFEAEKHRNKQYLKLKHDKIEETKKERVLTNGFRSGVLGVNITERSTINYKNWGTLNKDSEESNAELHRKARAMNILGHTAPSANIQFFNPYSNEAEPEKARGLKKVEEIPEHYHDTHNALFVPKPESSNVERTQRLKELWRGNRDFNIISGAYFNI